MFEIVSQDKEELTHEDVVYFDRLISNIVCYPDHIQFNGRTKQLYMGNPFTTIINEARWTSLKKNKFESYLINKFNDIDRFNEWVLNKRGKVYDSKALSVSFAKEKDFNLVFVKVNNSYLECWARDSKYNGQVKYIQNSRDSRFYHTIINYLREIQNLKIIQNIRSDSKLIDSLKFEINQGLHVSDKEIKQISNNKEDLCLAYIPLNSLKSGNYQAWEEFMKQLAFDSHKQLFMAWIYGVFVDDDFNRQILWLEGEGYTGKSTVFSVLGKILFNFNEELFKTITDRDNFDKFSLEGYDRCRLAVFADANEDDFFSRRDVITMTGGDYISINRKNKPIQTKKINCKIAVYSNYPPKIDYKLMHQKTRLLHIWIDPQKINRNTWSQGNKSYAARLESEFKYFLADCKQHYDNLMSFNGLLVN